MKLVKWLKKMFVPHEENNHHPHFWKKNSIALLLAFILMVEVGVFAQSFLNLQKNSYLAAILPAVLEALTNDQRTVNNASPLSENALLQQAAELKAKDMATRGYFAHNTPEGYLPWYWLEKVGYQYDHAGENLAVNFTDSKDVVDAWMNSPTHRENIVKPIYSETGIGLASGVYEGRPAVFVAQFFGTPKTVVTAAVEVPIKKVVVAVKPKPVAVEVNVPVATTTIVSATTTQVAGAETDSRIQKATPLQVLATSPRHVGGVVLIILLGFVLGAFLLILIVNGKVHHPKIIMSAALLVIVLTGSMLFNEKVLKDKVIVGEGTSLTF